MSLAQGLGRMSHQAGVVTFRLCTHTTWREWAGWCLALQSQVGVVDDANESLRLGQNGLLFLKAV